MFKYDGIRLKPKIHSTNYVKSIIFTSFMNKRIHIPSTISGYKCETITILLITKHFSYAVSKTECHCSPYEKV